MYPEIKDPSAFLWEVSWRHVGWIGILRKLWTLCGEQAICLCKNVSVCADEPFSSSSMFQGSFLDLGLFFKQNYDKVSLIASLGCNMERAKLGEGIRKHIPAKRQQLCCCVLFALPLCHSFQQGLVMLLLVLERAAHCSGSSTFGSECDEPPVMSHGGERGDWGWHPAGLGNDKVGLFKGRGR